MQPKLTFAMIKSHLCTLCLDLSFPPHIEYDPHHNQTVKNRFANQVSHPSSRLIEYLLPNMLMVNLLPNTRSHQNVIHL